MSALPTTTDIIASEASRLSNDVLGTFTAFEDEVREAIGNTNYRVIFDEAKRVEAAIAKARGEQ